MCLGAAAAHPALLEPLWLRGVGFRWQFWRRNARIAILQWSLRLRSCLRSVKETLAVPEQSGVSGVGKGGLSCWDGWSLLAAYLQSRALATAPRGGRTAFEKVGRKLRLPDDFCRKPDGN